MSSTRNNRNGDRLSHMGQDPFLPFFSERRRNPMKKIFSRQSILPDRVNHYDGRGHKIGYSRTTLLGYTNHYDEHGHKVGRSREGLFGTVHYDESGHRVGRSHESILGYQNHYDNHGHKVGYTRDTLLGKTTRIKK